jgi:hypothetical protein
MVIITSMDIDQVYLSTLDELKKKRKRKMNTVRADLCRSVRIREGVPAKNWAFHLVQRHIPLANTTDSRQQIVIHCNKNSLFYAILSCATTR